MSKKYSGLLFKCFSILFLFLALLSCRKQKPEKVNRAFYYWKTTFTLTESEIQKLNQTGIHKMYVRFFDVKWDKKRNEAQPVAPLVFRSALPPNLEIVPTVYITNETLLNLPQKLVPRLAAKILQKVEALAEKGKTPEIKEIQLDCDWSEKTRSNYFALVKALKEKLHQQKMRLSVTIRLHQIKYANRTGTPPADRGMLMFYNMGKISANLKTNSIYEPETAKNYLQNFRSYSLPLDVALPAFSWAIIIRKEKPIGLLNNFRKKDLQQERSFKNIGNNQFEVQELLFLQKQYLYPGDVLKLEEITAAETKAAAKQIAPFLKADTINAALYHWDPKNLENYSENDLEEIYNSLL